LYSFTCEILSAIVKASQSLRVLGMLEAHKAGAKESAAALQRTAARQYIFDGSTLHKE
jgi:hypothetical protein